MKYVKTKDKNIMLETELNDKKELIKMLKGL